MRYRLFFGLTVGALFTGHAGAAVLVTAVESGGNVIFNGSGSANLAGLTYQSSPSTASGINPVGGVVSFGGLADAYSGISGPSSIGTGSLLLADSASGDTLAIVALNGTVRFNAGYVSGGAISSTMTFNGATFASLDLTPGTYVWNWGNGAVGDTFTLQIGAVPEPATIAALSLGGLALVRRRRKAA